MAARANYIIDQGANFSSTVTVKDSQGVALNLTGYTASANMALGHASTRTRTALTIEFASDRTTGNVSMSLTAAAYTRNAASAASVKSKLTRSNCPMARSLTCTHCHFQ